MFKIQVWSNEEAAVFPTVVGDISYVTSYWQTEEAFLNF